MQATYVVKYSEFRVKVTQPVLSELTWQSHPIGDDSLDLLAADFPGALKGFTLLLRLVWLAVELSPERVEP